MAETAVRNYRQFDHVGVATNSGHEDKKQRLMELLEEAAELSAGDLQVYVNGYPLTRTLYGVMGHLQRSMDPKV